MKRIIELTAGEGGDHARDLTRRLAQAYCKWLDAKG